MTLQERRKQFAKELYDEHYGETRVMDEYGVMPVKVKKSKRTNKVKTEKEVVKRNITPKPKNESGDNTAKKRGRPKGSKNAKKRLF